MPRDGHTVLQGFTAAGWILAQHSPVPAAPGSLPTAKLPGAQLEGGFGSPAVLHGSECGLCAAVNLQVHLRLRGLSEDNTLTNMKCASYGSPPCPEHLAVLKVSSPISGSRGKNPVLFRVTFFAAICPFAKNKQNSFR